MARCRVRYRYRCGSPNWAWIGPELIITAVMIVGAAIAAVMVVVVIAMLLYICQDRQNATANNPKGENSSMNESENSRMKTLAARAQNNSNVRSMKARLMARLQEVQREFPEFSMVLADDPGWGEVMCAACYRGQEIKECTRCDRKNIAYGYRGDVISLVARATKMVQEDTAEKTAEKDRKN